VFLIIESSSLVTRLAHVILSGQLPQHSVEVCSVFCSFHIILANQNANNDPSNSHAFLPPDVTLENRFRQPPAKGYIPAQRTTNTQKRFVT